LARAGKYDPAITAAAALTDKTNFFIDPLLSARMAPEEPPSVTSLQMSTGRFAKGYSSLKVKASLVNGFE
jgi:hypothetical protein